SFLTKSAYSFVELNGESPAGIAYADAAYDIFSSLPVMKEFSKDYNVRPMYGRRFMLDVLLSSYEEFLGRKPERPPRIAIVDLAGVPTVKEFELFREFFEQAGYPSVICTPQQLEFKDNRLSVSGQAIDIVYSCRSKLIHKKALFAVLTDPKHAALFSSQELEAIHAHVPWTRMVRDEHTDYFGREVNLLDFIRADGERLVLKPNDDYGGHGITIGWNVDQRGWDEAINNALADGDYLVQERVPTARETFPAHTDDGRIEFAEQL